MKKVLIITYYWPPSGGAGVQRWLKFVKYLREFGWEPIIYTPENPEAPAIDNSLMKDIPPNLTIIKTPIWEPYNLYKKFIGIRKEQKINAGFLSEIKKPRLKEKIAVWIRGNFFIPDARRWWVNPSVKFLVSYLKQNPVEVVISTGPPHSMHLIALGLKKKIGIKWLADFRDPWTNIDFYDKLMLTKSSDRKQKKLENEVLKNANTVSTVSWNWAEDFKRIAKREIEVVTNGFDEDDFTNTNVTLESGFMFHHIGAMNADRNPHKFWEALKEICDADKFFSDELKIKLTGKTDIKVIESIKKNGLWEKADKIDHLPHDKIVQALPKSPILLLPLNDTPNTRGIIPGKLFEYLASRRPIFVIGNELGDTARIINETKSGIVVDFHNKEKMKSEIIKLYEGYKKNPHAISSGQINKYSRKNGAKRFAELLNQITVQ